MRSVAAALAAVVAAGAAAGTARAHGDPAGDYLVSRSVFLPAGHRVSGTAAARLAAVVADAAKGGYPIRVALIGSPLDLGAERGSWLHAQSYARDLDRDLVYAYRGPVLVAMPNGFGLVGPGTTAAADRRLLATIRPGAGPDGLAHAAVRAVVALAAAHGVPVTVPRHVTTAARRNRSDRILIGAATLVALLGWAMARTGARRRGLAS